MPETTALQKSSIVCAVESSSESSSSTFRPSQRLDRTRSRRRHKLMANSTSRDSEPTYPHWNRLFKRNPWSYVCFSKSSSMHAETSAWCQLPCRVRLRATPWHAHSATMPRVANEDEHRQLVCDLRERAKPATTQCSVEQPRQMTRGIHPKDS